MHPPTTRSNDCPTYPPSPKAHSTPATTRTAAAPPATPAYIFPASSDARYLSKGIATGTYPKNHYRYTYTPNGSYCHKDCNIPADRSNHIQKSYAKKDSREINSYKK